MKISKLLFGGLLAALFAPPVLASAQDIYVVRNPASRHPVVASTRDADPRVRLSEGEVAVIYYPGGRMTRIPGPYDDRASAHARDTPGRVISEVTEILVTAREQEKSGFTRAAGDPPPPPPPPQGLGMLDVSVSVDAKQCYHSLPVRLWRARLDQQEEVVVALIGGASATVRFAPGAAYAEWPKTVGLGGGVGQYVISTPDGRTPTHRFELAALKLDDPDDLTLASLVQQGCDQQAKLAASIIVSGKP